MEQQTFGFIGVGRMGGLMSTRLLNIGHRVVVYDVSRGRCRCAGKTRRAARGLSRCMSRSQADTVFLSLPNPEIVQRSALQTGGVIEGTRVKRVVDFSTIGPRTANLVAKGLAERRYRLRRRAGERRTQGRARRHACRDGVLSQSRVCRSGADPQDFRQALPSRRKRRPGTDHEARQQSAGRRGHCADFRGDGDGCQGRAQSEGDARRAQCRIGTQQRHAGQIPQVGAAWNVSISGSPPDFRTRMCACASTKRRRSACRWSAVLPCARCLQSPTRCTVPTRISHRCAKSSSPGPVSKCAASACILALPFERRITFCSGRLPCRLPPDR